MVTLDQLKAIYNNDDAELHYAYLNDKHKGGINNSKGNNLENHFTVYEIAKSFNENANYENTFFSSQAFSFIDDLIIELNNNLFKFFQIKDVQNLSWDSGKHPIGSDFEIQYNVYRNTGKNAELYLTVSRKEVYDSMVADLPKHISAFTKVVHFETADSINSLIRTNNHFKDELIKMCAISNPSSDKLDALGTIILGAWDATDKKQQSLKILLDRCYNQNPNYIKGFEGRLSEHLNSLLNSIKGFTFKIENGYLVWSYNTTDIGTLSCAIGTKEFIQWESDITNLAPINSFEIIEPFLS
jgi:hypothetical protein